MRNRRRTASLVLLGFITISWVVGAAAPVGAEVIQGGCTGSVTFSDGTTVNESTPLSQVVIVPDDDTVAYQGNINLDPPNDPVPFSGGVDVRLPFGGWTVVPWSGDTEAVAAAGDYAYGVPGFVPRGTGGLEVTAIHIQQGQTCVIAVTMALAGDPGPAALIGATGTVLFGAATIAAGMKKKVA